MDFEFDDDQLGLQAAVAEVLAKECPASFLRSVVDDGHDPADLWSTLQALDWPGLAIAEEDGGIGATAVELALVVEQLGYVGDPTPFLATTTQFAPVVAACGDAEQRRRFLGPIVTEGAAGAAVFTPSFEARRTADGWVLSGAASFVLDADRATEIAVVASTGEVFVVPATAARITRTRAFDLSLHVGEVHLEGVEVGDDRRLDGAGIERAREEALTGLALMTVGACQRALDIVVEHVRSREQFGVPIGSFQAVKHKAVDMHVAIERARALGYFAALTIAEDDPRRSLAASMAKAAAGDAQRIVVTHGIQLFGGLGFTWENDLQLYLRRARAGELLLGGAAEHRAKVGRALLAAARPTEELTGATDLR